MGRLIQQKTVLIRAGEKPLERAMKDARIMAAQDVLFHPIF
jgi:hypothetical protein